MGTTTLSVGGKPQYVSSKQLKEWNILRDAYGFGGHGRGAAWVDYVITHMGDLYKWTRKDSEKPGGYVESFKRVESMRRDFYGEGS